MDIRPKKGEEKFSFQTSVDGVHNHLWLIHKLTVVERGKGRFDLRCSVVDNFFSHFSLACIPSDAIRGEKLECCI